MAFRPSEIGSEDEIIRAISLQKNNEKHDWMNDIPMNEKIKQGHLSINGGNPCN